MKQKKSTAPAVPGKNPSPGKKSFQVSKPVQNIAVSHKWTAAVLVLSFALSVGFSAVTTTALAQLNLVWAFCVLLVIIFINILFDMVATATQTAEEHPFHSLAARRVAGASQSVAIIRHAPQVANLCADVIGDIAGIISGGATTLIIAELVSVFHFSGIWPSLTLTGLVSSLTIGGKAFCKGIAMYNSNAIVFVMGKIIYYTLLPFRLKPKRKKRK